MGDTLVPEAGRMSETKYRLRAGVFTDLARKRDATTRAAQAELTGLPRATFYRILSGQPPSMASAMQIADRLHVPLDALFERVESA
jgi:DNA-binding XRE family transcriptional regulator